MRITNHNRSLKQPHAFKCTELIEYSRNVLQKPETTFYNFVLLPFQLQFAPKTKE